ncbi:MAG: cardiolipin synthase [Bacteroidales bacterium]|nr:cardiolipin synthase [Bacteroidales bacterium]
MILLFFDTLAWDWISVTSVVIAYVFVIYLVIKTILQNRNPITTLSWIMVLILIPFLGLILYFLFGQKITKKWILKRMHNKELIQMTQISNKQLKTLQDLDQIDDEYLSEYRKLISILLKNNSSFLSSNNQIQLFHFGASLYQSIYKDLELATEFIHMEYYMFEEGKVANRLSDILIKKKKQGLNVSLILDGIGSRGLSSAYVKKLQDNKVEVLLFRPVRFPNFTNKINNRNHRKIIVIDGKIGYTGGINMADKYLVNYGDTGFWRDTHLRVIGDSIKMLEAVFLVDRYNLTKHIYKNLSPFFPQVNYLPATTVQIATNSPESGTSNILNAFFIAITTAKSSIRLISPYFIPDESLLMALKTAAAGGVNVEIMLPGVKDSAFIQYSARSYVQQLLKNDIKVYFYLKGFIHAKVILIDDTFSMLGSANFDYRSFYQNFEINTLIYDREINKKLVAQFQIDKNDSKQIHLSRWRKRPIRDKIFESIARLLAPLM